MAVVGTGMVSLTSFAVSISIAKVSSVSTFGAFSFAMVSYLFSSGLIRAALTNATLSRPGDPDTFRSSLQRASLVSLVASLFIIVWGAISGNLYLLVLGLFLHGLLILDFLRISDSATGNAIRSLIATSVWSVFSIFASIASFLYAIEPLIVFAVWASIGSICGYVLAAVSRANITPFWARNLTDTRNAAVFTADYLIGAGGGQLTTGLLGFVGDARILSAVRGAGTLLGPMNLISTTARSLMLPFLARDQDNRSRQMRSALAAVAVQVITLVPLLIILQFIPDQLGEQLLGDTWWIASLAILPLSIDSIFNVIMAPAIAGHRVAFAGRRTLSIRLLIGLPRPFLVLFSAYTWGIIGAAWAMATVALIGSVVWWISYYDLSRRASQNS